MSAAKKRWADEEDSSDEEGCFDEEPVQESAAQVEPTTVPEPAPEGTSEAAAPRGTGERGNQRPRNTKAPEKPPYRAFLSNLAFRVTSDDIIDFFAGGDCRVTHVNLRKDRNSDRLDGTAIITFETGAQLEKAMEAHGMALVGRVLQIRVFEDYGGSNRGGGGRGDRKGGRGDRDREGGRGRDRDRDRRGKGRDTGDEGEWSRRSAPAPAPGAAPANSAAAEAGESSSAPQRPKLDLKPRSIPLNSEGSPAPKSSIFGEGKAREETPAAGAAPKEPKPEKKPAEGRSGDTRQREDRKQGGGPSTVFNKAIKESVRSSGSNKSGGKPSGNTKTAKPAAAAAPAAKSSAPSKPRPEPAPVVNKATQNGFGALADDDDDEDE